MKRHNLKMKRIKRNLSGQKGQGKMIELDTGGPGQISGEITVLETELVPMHKINSVFDF